MHCRLLQQGDLSGAEQALTDVENMSAELFSPALRAQQLCYWARLAHCQVQDVAAVGSKESAHWCLQALYACEWARALAPGIWRQVTACLTSPPAFLNVDVARLLNMAMHCGICLYLAVGELVRTMYHCGCGEKIACTQLNHTPTQQISSR